MKVSSNFQQQPFSKGLLFTFMACSSDLICPFAMFHRFSVKKPFQEIAILWKFSERNNKGCSSMAMRAKGYFYLWHFHLWHFHLIFLLLSYGISTFYWFSMNKPLPGDGGHFMTFSFDTPDREKPFKSMWKGVSFYGISSDFSKGFRKETIPVNGIPLVTVSSDFPERNSTGFPSSVHGTFI